MTLIDRLKEHWPFFVFLAITTCAVAALGLKMEDQAKDYKAACIKLEGKPVHNGKNWECMK